MNPVTIDVPIDDVIKILGYYGEPVPTIFIYTTHLAAIGIRYLLNMHENNMNYFFDPLSEGINLYRLYLDRLYLDIYQYFVYGFR